MINVYESTNDQLKWSKFKDLYGGTNDTWIGSCDMYPVSYEIYKKSSTNYDVKEVGNKGQFLTLGWARTLAAAKEIANKQFDKFKGYYKK